MPRAWHEPAGWVVRESVTNVLRHSSASVVEITYADGRLRVRNDGAQPNGSAPTAPACEGCASASYRSALRWSRDRDRDDGWAVVAELPGTGPLSATDR